jgi:hypothetical protein
VVVVMMLVVGSYSMIGNFHYLHWMVVLRKNSGIDCYHKVVAGSYAAVNKRSLGAGQGMGYMCLPDTEGHQMVDLSALVVVGLER